MSLVKLVSHAVAVTALTALLVDCGGSGAGNSVAPARNAGGETAAQSVVVTVNIPGRTPAGVRRTKYVGTGTQSAVFSVTLAGSTPAPNVTANCTTTCQATLSVFPGSNTFTVSLYDAANGSGNLLSTGSTTQTIVAGTNTVNLTFNGVPATVVISPNPTSLPSGTPGTSTLTVSALDADGNTIVTPGSYTQTITLASDQTYLTLSPTTVTAPGQTVTATYDGTAVGVNTTVNISSAIGSASPVNITGVTISTLSTGITLSPAGMVAVTSGGGTNTVTVSETGFAGTFTISSNTCTGPGNATISPSSGSGPSATFTITGEASTSPGPGCSFTFSDGTNSSTIMVNVN